MRRLLLVSNSTLHGSGYLEHCAGEVRRFMGNGDANSILFVPYALHDRDAYAARARGAWEDWGFAFSSIHQAADPVAAVAQAQALFIGGGNTFRLLDALYCENLLDPIRKRSAEGMPYMGTSAGSNVAAASIKTTNDMPIAMPPSFTALGLVPFNINPHYLDADPGSTHMGETREQRITEFHELNSEPVLGLREGAMLRVEGDEMTLLGSTGARIFEVGKPPVEVDSDADLSRFLHVSGT